MLSYRAEAEKSVNHILMISRNVDVLLKGIIPSSKEIIHTFVERYMSHQLTDKIKLSKAHI